MKHLFLLAKLNSGLLAILLEIFHRKDKLQLTSSFILLDNKKYKCSQLNKQTLTASACEYIWLAVFGY